MREKKLTKLKFLTVKNNIFHGGSYFEKEGLKLGLSGWELQNLVERYYDGGKKNTQFKDMIRTSRINASLVLRKKQ